MFRPEPTPTISAPLRAPRSRPAPQREARTGRVAVFPIDEALAKLKGRELGLGIKATPSTPVTSRSAPPKTKQGAARVQRGIAAQITETQETLMGHRGPGAHAPPSWPSSPKAPPDAATLRRMGMHVGPAEAALEGLAQPTFAQKKAAFEKMDLSNGVQPLPSWLHSASPSSGLSSAQSAMTSDRRSGSINSRNSVDSKSVFSIVQSSVSSTSTRSADPADHPAFPSGPSSPVQRVAGVRRLNATARGPGQDVASFERAVAVAIPAYLKPTKIEITASGQAIVADKDTPMPALHTLEPLRHGGMGTPAVAPSERPGLDERSREHTAYSR